MKILSNKKWDNIDFELFALKQGVVQLKSDRDMFKRERNVEIGNVQFLKSEIDKLNMQLSAANKCLDAYRNPVAQTNPVISKDLDDWKDAQRLKLFEDRTKDTGQGIFDKLADQMNLLNWKIEKEKESELEFNKWKSEEIKKFNKAAMCYSINGEIYKQELVFTKTK